MSMTATPAADPKMVSLVPGVYRKEGRARTLLEVRGKKCVYVFGELEEKAENDSCPLPATTCTQRTFVRAVGKKPVRELAPAETEKLRNRMICRVSYRRANRYEKSLFFANRKAANHDDRAIAADPAQDPAPQASPLPSRETPGLLVRLMDAVKTCVRRLNDFVFNRKPRVGAVAAQTVEGGVR